MQRPFWWVQSPVWLLVLSLPSTFPFATRIGYSPFPTLPCDFFPMTLPKQILRIKHFPQLCFLSISLSNLSHSPRFHFNYRFPLKLLPKCSPTSASLFWVSSLNSCCIRCAPFLALKEELPCFTNAYRLDPSPLLDFNPVKCRDNFLSSLSLKNLAQSLRQRKAP